LRPTPATETEVNYDALATQFGGVAGETPVDPADREATFFGEFGRGFGTTVETAKFIPEVVGLQNAAATSSTARKELAMFDRIDKGEPVTPELLAGSGLSGLFVNMYKNASPEKRQKLRDMQAKQLSEAQKQTEELLPALKELDARREKTSPRVANATDIESLNDFKDWLGYNAGAVIPQIGLTMAGAAIAGIPGALLTSTAFNFPAQIEQRVEFIMSTVKDLPPEDQAKAVMEYLDKTGDVTFAVTALQGGLDMFGPVGAILRKN